MDDQNTSLKNLKTEEIEDNIVNSKELSNKNVKKEITVQKFDIDIQATYHLPELLNKIQTYEKYNLLTSLPHNAKPTSLDCIEVSNNVIIAVGTESGKIFIWDLNFNKTIKTIGAHDFFIDCLGFLEINNHIILISGCIDHYIKVWDPNKEEIIQKIDNLARPLCFTFHNIDVKYFVVVSSNDSSIKIWDINDGSLYLTIADLKCQILSIIVQKLKMESIIICGCDDKVIKIYSLNKKSNVRQLLPKHDGNVYSLTYLEINYQQLIASGTYEIIRLFDLVSGELVRSWQGHNDFILALTVFQLHCKLPVLVSGSKDATIKIWNPEDKSLLLTLEDHTKKVFRLKSVQFKLQHIIVSASSDRTVKVFI